MCLGGNKNGGGGGGGGGRKVVSVLCDALVIYRPMKLIV